MGRQLELMDESGKTHKGNVQYVENPHPVDKLIVPSSTFRGPTVVIKWKCIT